uniref:X1.C.D3.1 n=1 Tax=Schmidtea mediterranea TaxID=79327 RepID=V9XRU8_SCHMD|nr:X1.C.D3.1 [Schmidtea mediterranea]
MSLIQYSDIHFNNMESMVSSSIRKYRIQTASTKEPNLLYKLMVSKVIVKLKEILFDPDFISSNEQNKQPNRESSDKVIYESRCIRVADRVIDGSEKMKINSQLQTMLKKRIAAKSKRQIPGGEIRTKIRKTVSKENVCIYNKSDFNNSYALLIPVHSCVANS